LGELRPSEAAGEFPSPRQPVINLWVIAVACEDLPGQASADCCGIAKGQGSRENSTWLILRPHDFRGNIR
jgi:hypothetical protein